MPGEVLVVAVGDLEAEVLVDGEVDDLVPVVVVVLLVAPAVVVALPPTADPDVLETVLPGPGEEYLDGEELAVRLLARDTVADFVDVGWVERVLEVVEAFPELEDGKVALTTDTSVADEAFMEGATVTMPTVVVTTRAADEEFEEVVSVEARAAIAPEEPLTAAAEVREVVVVPDVVERITGATTAVTTVADVLEALDPNPPTEPTEFDVVLPTAATTDGEVLTKPESDAVDPAVVVDEANDLEDSRTVGLETSDDATDVAAEVCEGEPETLSTPEVLAAVDTGLVIPYGRGAKQHIIWALEDDLAPLVVMSSCLSIVTRTAEVFPAEDDTEFEVTIMLPDSPTAIFMPLDSAG